MAMKTSICQSVDLWHKRMGHLNMNALKLLHEQDMVVGMLELKNTSVICEGCAFGKHCRDSFPRKTNWRAFLPLELVHSNIYGLMQTSTKAGNKYFMPL